MTKFTLQIDPPKTTHQSGLRILKRADGKMFVGKYAKSKSKQAQNQLISALRPHAPKMPYAGAVIVSAIYTYQHPKSASKAVKSQTIPHTKKPDVDNSAKALLDALTAAGFFHDDKQIAELRFAKYEASEPSIKIFIDNIN